MKITIAYMTGRREPNVFWVTEELGKQAQPGDDIEFIVIDYFGRTPAQLGLAHVVGFTRGITSLRIAKPKPNIWQGEHRITKEDWWAMSNARNTAFCLASRDYIAFLDDRLKIGPQWLAAVRRGESARESVLMGAYHKYDENGLKSSDDRLGYWPHGRIDAGGQRLYGCTFALPLEWALNVNGFEEGCDGISAEDYHFGWMLTNAGYRCDYVVDLMVHEDRSTGHVGHGMSPDKVFRREDKGVSPNDKSHKMLERFGQRRRTEFTHDLREIRRVLAEGGDFPAVDRNYEYRDWYDNQLINEL